MTLIGVAVYLVQLAIPSLLLILTPRHSLLRHLWILCSLWIAYQFFLLSHGYSGSLVRYTQGGVVIFVAVLQSANLLLVNPLDRNDLIQKQVIARSDGFFPSLRGSARLFFALRGLGTPWRLRYLPNRNFSLKSGLGSGILLGKLRFLSGSGSSWILSIWRRFDELLLHPAHIPPNIRFAFPKTGLRGSM